MLVLLCICGAVFRAPLLFWGRARLDSIVCVVCPPDFFGAVLYGVCVCLVFSLIHIELNRCLPRAHRPNITPRTPGVRCTTSALVCTSCTRGVQENAAIGLVVLQSAEILGLIVCFAIHFLCVTIE